MQKRCGGRTASAKPLMRRIARSSPSHDVEVLGLPYTVGTHDRATVRTAIIVRPEEGRRHPGRYVDGIRQEVCGGMRQKRVTEAVRPLDAGGGNPARTVIETDFERVAIALAIEQQLGVGRCRFAE